MATAEQLKTLIKSHFGNDPDRFSTIALQIAAHEARQGHGDVANEIRIIIDHAKHKPVRITFHRELEDLVLETEPNHRLGELVLSDSMKNRIQRILKEYKQQHKLKKHGLVHRRKLLLTGPPGTGKTMTASIIAKQLSLPFYTILMDKLVTKYMGETSAKLRQIFDLISKQQGVYLFDEFDAIGAERGLDNDVGEMRRVLNAFLQFIEQDKSDSLIIAATNNLTLLDQALFRRFDDVLHYELPTLKESAVLIDNRLGTFKGQFSSEKIAMHATKLSHGEIAQACDDAIKETILSDKQKVTREHLLAMLKDRHNAYGKRRI
ncbi:MAG: ATP-binding protein [Sedimentisphaerales bacterium]|nr:ATP-binding protein [Sedimentisphaerales bacterium]